MLGHLVLLAGAASIGAAFDADFPVWCKQDFQGSGCFQRVSDKCYDCLHPGEAACPGTDQQFLDCFCPIPSNSWTTIEKCLNDESSECNDHALGLHLILNNFATQCNKYNHQLCAAGAKLDDIEQQLVSVSCSDSPPAATDAPGTSAPAAAETTPAAGSATAQPSGGHPSMTNKPPATTSQPVVVVNAAPGMKNAGAQCAALVAAGVVMVAL